MTASQHPADKSLVRFLVGSTVVHLLALVVWGIISATSGPKFSPDVVVKTKLVKLPSQVSLAHIFPLSLIAAIGFTMAIFFSELSFGSDPTLLPIAKVSIIMASLIAALLGFVLMYWVSRKKAV